MILVCVQTDKARVRTGLRPAVRGADTAWPSSCPQPAGNIPLSFCSSSTLAPSSMTTVVREHFARYGLVEGRDILLGNSPNRVMPGRLVERVRASDKIVAGLHPATARADPAPVRAHRDPGHAAPNEQHDGGNREDARERVPRRAHCLRRRRWCADCDAARRRLLRVRETGESRRASPRTTIDDDPNAVPSGGLLVPTVGVGGHCLPKDGILLWWRAARGGVERSRSLILEARADQR